LDKSNNIFTKFAKIQAFTIVTTGMLVMMLAFIVAITYRIWSLRRDTGSVHSYSVMKNFFTYVDDLEFHVFNKKEINRAEFKEAVEKVTSLKVSEKESEFLFFMMDTDGDGLLHTERELKIRPQRDVPRNRGSLRKRLLRAFSSE